MTSRETGQTFSRLLIAHAEGTALSVRHQQTELQRLHNAVVEAKVDLINAIEADFGHSDFEAIFEYCSTLSNVREQYDGKDITTEVKQAKSLELGTDNLQRVVGEGIVYIVPATHTPLYSVISPLAAAIAAGNCVIVEILQTTSRLSSLLRNLLTESLNADTFAISKSRPGSELLRRCKVLMECDLIDVPGEQQHHLVCPSKLLNIAVVDRTADVAQTAHALGSSRFAFGGTSPYAPDLVMIHEAVKDLLVEQLTKRLPEYSKDRRGKASKEHSFDHGRSDVDAAFAKETNTIASYSRNKVVEVVEDDSRLLSEKRQNSTLLIYPVTSMDHAIDLAGSLGTFGVSYIFAAREESNYLANFINAQLTCVNQVPIELSIGPTAPLNFPASISPRFTQAMFQKPRPQLLTKSPLTQMTSSRNPLASPALQKWVAAAQRPLNPIGQCDGKRMGFFDQALMVGMTVSGLALSASVGIVATVVWRQLRVA